MMCQNLNFICDVQSTRNIVQLNRLKMSITIRINDSVVKLFD